MATYNGGLYIEEQLRSILPQLAEDDEIIVCDDCSNDDTIEKIKAISDARIKIYVNDRNLGYIKNFERAITLSNGEYIFLSDQDDIWPDNRVKVMLSALISSGKSVVVGNIECFFDSVLVRFPLNVQIVSAHNRAGYKNLARIMLGGLPCYGCAMAFSRKFVRHYIPFPAYSVSHDIWLALLANFKECVFYCDDVVVYRRVHGNNLTTSGRSLYAKLATRLCWLYMIILLLVRRGVV